MANQAIGNSSLLGNLKNRPNRSFEWLAAKPVPEKERAGALAGPFIFDPAPSGIEAEDDFRELKDKLSTPESGVSESCRLRFHPLYLLTRPQWARRPVQS